MAKYLEQLVNDLDEATSGKHEYHAWDTGGKTADRYTVMSHADHAFHKKTGRPVDALGMSDEPTHPQGVSQFGSATAGKHLGKKVPFHKLPSHIQAHTKARYGQNVSEETVDEATYGDKRDYPKRHIMVNGKYHSTTTWARTGKEAKDQFIKKYPEHATSKVHVVKEDMDDSEIDSIYDGEVVLSEEEADHDSAHELVLHADNDSHLYHSSHLPIVHNLEKKHRKGTYEPEKAKKLWKYHADRAAQSYHKAHGNPAQKWHHAFSPATRKAAASHWEQHHRHEMEAGNFHS